MRRDPLVKPVSRNVSPRVALVFLLFTAACSAVTPVPPKACGPGALEAGVDVLSSEQFSLLAGRKVALITNHTGLDCAGRRTVDRLASAPNLQLVSILSPEHGLAGQSEAPQEGDSMDAATGLPVFSLFRGDYAPTRAMLRGADTLVFDIQDIGTRFYTYISTMAIAMEFAAREKVRFLVLDRPNPITGSFVQGPTSDPESRAFVNYYPIALRHGMTVGELAIFFRSLRELDVHLEVVRMRNWRRSQWLDQTGWPWRNTSPNIRNLTAATLYPALGLLEPTNVSVGRGTDYPFEQFGAPWIDAPTLASALNALALPGVSFRPVKFTPSASVFAGTPCAGVGVELKSREAFDAATVGLSIGIVLRDLYPDHFDIQKFGGLLSNRLVHGLFLEKKSYEAMRAAWAPAFDEFSRRRKAALLYD